MSYEKLHKGNGNHNLNNAFHVAEDKLGLTALLDAEGTRSSLYAIMSVIIYYIDPMCGDLVSIMAAV